MAKAGPTEEHLDPTAEITLEVVKQRAVKGVAVLTGRTFLLSFISLAATGFLGAFLSESQFGIFFIVSAIVNFLAYFSDVGLAASLIQKKEKVLESDLKTTFTVQQVLVLVILLIIFLATPIFESAYSLSYEGKMLLYALSFSLLLSSLKTIPSVLIERDLDFSRLVLPQVLENVVYHITAVYFAWQGAGVMSFAYAVVARGVTGLVAIYVLRPWIPGFAFSKKALKKLLKFGIPYQVNTFLATIKDDGMTVFLGGILGVSGIGILGWAQKWAYYPLRLFMDHVLKVTFPAFSRMQDRKVHLARSVSRSIFFVCFLVFPSIVGLIILSPLLVEIIPRYEKWRPALLPLALISVNTVFAASTTQLTNLFNAIGKIKITFRLMVMWTVLTWVLVPFLAIRYGVNGAAAGYALVGISSIVPMYIAYRYVAYSIIDSIIKPGGAAIFMGIIMLVIRQVLPVNLVSVWIIAAIGTLTYGMVSYLIFGQSIIADVQKLAKNFLKK